jgi:hypothetical protein
MFNRLASGNAFCVGGGRHCDVGLTQAPLVVKLGEY